MNWRQQVKIFADKNIKGSNRSETSGTISYSVPEERRLTLTETMDSKKMDRKLMTRAAAT